ncbi:MAG: hypothetical protein HYX25_06715 [Candidatus Solibacter usitatus]|nr:hypothetical protein [Candidatus Solibacter usitatus]
MREHFATMLVAAALAAGPAFSAEMQRPRPGKVEIMKSSELKPGMKGEAWTVFQGTEAESIPVEIIGVWKNAWGPKQDTILAKLGGKAQRTNVAGGMSGSPVYIDGKLVGAIALRLSVFSPDAICGITPIELMLEINDLDKSRPTDARTPDKVQARSQIAVPGELLGQLVAAGAASNLPAQTPLMTPIEMPLAFSGFQENVLREFNPLFQQMGITAVQGGAGSAMYTTKPAAGWQSSLAPGDVVAGVLVSGDMSVTGVGTVTYNDGKRVLAFGHPFFNLGPVTMPMAKGEVLMVLASAFQPNKFANATEIVGALHQDRHSGIMGVLGEETQMIPVSVKVRSFGERDTVRAEKEFRFNIFDQQKWTPYLMMLTLYNSVSGLNEFMDEATYRLNGKVELEGGAAGLSLNTMQASGDMPMPAPILLAGWWGDKFSRLYLNPVNTPRVKRVSVTVDLLPERRVATIENAWAATSEARAGEDVPVRVFLRPYRGDRIEREIKVHIPAGVARGEHRVLLGDADTLNRVQSIAGSLSRSIDVPQTVSLINQERSNNRLYVALLEASPTAYYDDKMMPSVPASVLNVMQSGRTSSRPIVTSPESATEQASIPFDYVINGSFTLKINVK